MTDQERYIVAASAYRALKHVVDVLNLHEVVEGKYIIHYPKVLQVDNQVYLTSKFDDDFVGRIMNM